MFQLNEYEAVMTNIDPLGQSLYEQWSASCPELISTAK